jgi:hypothetical protein
MQIGSLDLPDELLTALEGKRLVIFAGAGVSIPPPANLPSFKELVEDIIGRPLSDDVDQGQLDRVLGRERDQGRVHRLAANRLSQTGSRFNSLHQNLAALFGSAAAVRIVTTNFDQHFEGAISAQPGLAGIKIYSAPALPVGSSFSGLVHLHGVLDGDSDSLVLTDADFGRAYLAEGWAGRFVLELFREYVVLFAGYSYGDTVMSYLTRGLAPTFGRQRYALAELGQRKKWELLGIQPIEYDPADNHRALAVGLGHWVSLQRRGFLDWSQRLPALVSREPRALAPDERGELEFCLRNPKRAKLFYRHATDPSWLRWAEETGRFQPLFSYESNSEELWDLAHWFTEEPLGERGKVALEIALASFRPASGVLAVVASQQVHMALKAMHASGALGAVAGQRVAAWATLLIERTAPNTPPAHLGYWLDYLSPQSQQQPMMQILARLLRCRPTFREEGNWGRESELSLSLETPHSADDIGTGWSELRKHLSALAWPLVPVITEIFEARWRWLVGLEGTTHNNDPWGWRRSWVERPSGAGSPHSFDDREAGPLLDIGKDVLDELMACVPERAAAVIELWLAATAPQLVQLGLYGLARSSRWKPAKKLERLLAEFLPAGMPYKVEVFRVLQKSYPVLTTRQRERFLERVGGVYRRRIKERKDDPDRGSSSAYEWFNVLVWLERAAPGDPALARPMVRIRKMYPKFSPRDHPEMDIVHLEERREPAASFLSSKEITGLPLSRWLEMLEASHKRHDSEGFAGDHLRGFLEETARAASSDLEWGLSFARGLVESGQFDHEVWPRLLSAWGDRSFKPGEWKKLLEVLEVPQLLSAQTWGVTEVLRGCIKRGESKSTGPMLRSGLRLAEKLLPLAERFPPTILSENEDWLSQAINHPGGHLAEYLIGVAGQLARQRPQRGAGIPRACRQLFESMTKGGGTASAMARVVLASQAHFLLGIDPDWTRANLLQLFDWDLDSGQAVQAWHGFLTWGRPGAAILDALTPAAVQLASHLEELGGEREHYGTFVARGAFALPDDPLGKDWFQAFLSAADGDDRARFTWELDHLLESLNSVQKAEIWGDWLDRYLERRAEYPPNPESDEFTALAGLAFRFPEQLEKLVERLEVMPGNGGADDRLFWKLSQGELPGADPNLLGGLLLVTLNRGEDVDHWGLSPLFDAIARLIKEGTDEGLVRKLVERFLEQGGLNHEALLQLLQAR